ncbi:hypothetical protein RZR97_00785 [Hydrogenimonas thermophila]|uniref:hypothetical protein n=1 Tax=Hydrogenimonas thermophila TaxID=223786 RepID=UPI0029372A00|nr:hypothetical protein [Hydrogenimonas thermophila]WOE70131.1 hypothetical protein RZR91_00785 [Hydrogenimonas thermophila]WOE72648.1 hypothetical protein RZR97_00785 [Hydrogenimonas thermophila]
MLVEIKNKEMVKHLKKLAEEEGVDVNELVTDLLAFSMDHAIATLAMRRIEYALINEIIPSIKSAEVNIFAARNQITNMHADILEDPDRALAISEEAGKIGEEVAFGNNNNADDE